MSHDTVSRVRVDGLRQVTTVSMPLSVVNAGEALIRTHVVGICGSDLQAAHGLHPFMPLPYYPGHEAVGVIEELAADVLGGYGVGDRVLIEPNLACHNCERCLAGE